ncbi:Clavaminate synthase-like protein [Trichoderma sp. SZMC 28011]
MAEVPQQIPTIDISAWVNPASSAADKQRVVDEVHHAATTYGFFQCAGHGITPETREQIFNLSKRFFSLPMEERMEISVKKSLGQSFRGYEPPFLQNHHKHLLPDTKETFVVGAEIPADHPDAGTFLNGPNLWPTSIPEDDFRKPLISYQSQMVALGNTLLKILGHGLPKSWNCSPDVFDSLAENPAIPMRMLHYAAQPVHDEKQFGVGAHTDFGSVTILLQQLGTKGLEVWYPPTETWIPVPPKENTFVINIGDFVDRYTNGYYRSARHRVITTDKERYSVAFFFNGNMKLKAPVLDGSGGEVNLGDHIRQRAIATYGAAPTLIESKV